MNKQIIIVSVITIIAVIIYLNFEQLKIYFEKMKLKSQQAGFVRSLNVKARPITTDFIKEVEKRTGYTVYITSAYRSPIEQIELAERESLAVTTHLGSFHNFGLAFDLNIFKGSEWINSKSSKQKWIDSGIVDIANEFGIRWGGNFSTYDPVHFDFGKYYTISYLKELALLTYGETLDNFEGNKLNLKQVA